MTPDLSLRDRMRRLTAAVLVAVYALFATLGTSLVICEEQGGHVAIEWRGADCCAERTPAPAPAGAETANAPGAQGDAEDCGTCDDDDASDLIMSRAANAARAPSVPDPADLPATVVVTECRSDRMPRVTARPAGSCAEPVPPPPLAAIRTVVLRC